MTPDPGQRLTIQVVAHGGAVEQIVTVLDAQRRR